MREVLLITLSNMWYHKKRLPSLTGPPTVLRICMIYGDSRVHLEVCNYVWYLIYMSYRAAHNYLTFWSNIRTVETKIKQCNRSIPLCFFSVKMKPYWYCLICKRSFTDRVTHVVHDPHTRRWQSSFRSLQLWVIPHFHSYWAANQRTLWSTTRTGETSVK